MADQATKLAPAPDTPDTSIESHPTYEEIAALAYTLWQARGCPDGTADEDWLNAETALTSKSDA